MERGTRTLEVDAADKPLDIGNGRVAASIGLTGQVQAVSTLHDTHGYMVLSGDPAFDDRDRYDQDAVREHRRRLADPAGPGITLSTTPGWSVQQVSLLAGALPRHHLRTGQLRATVTTWAPLQPAAAGIVQAWDLHNDAAEPVHLAAALTGVERLARATLTQLTEGGIRPAPDPMTTMTVEHGRVVLHSPGLPAVAIIDAGVIDADGTARPAELPQLALTVPPDAPVRLVLRLCLAPSRLQAERELRALTADTLEPTITAWTRRTDAARRALPADARVEPLVSRAITYATGCCTVAVAGTTCVLTDHRILPLTWTRDAYWTVTALAETDPDGTADLVRGHLAWLFDIADRTDGWWARSYLPTGRVKDPAHQLDQQCYPVLEAIDHAHRCDDQATLARHAPAIGDVLDRLLDQRHPTGLMATTETPADDPLDQPYHLSSNLLAAHTFRQAGRVADLLDLDPTRLDEAATTTLSAIARHLTIEVDGRACLAYATDLASPPRWYHDANDVPTVLARRWGLDLPEGTWHNTMALAFSPATSETAIPGRFGGLGSVHTPGAWPLGDAQELMVAALTGDRARASAVLDRLAATAAWDGSLPEARDPDTGAATSRHWFAWPGCLLVLALQMLTDPSAGSW